MYRTVIYETSYIFFRRVLRKLDLDLSDDVIRALANTTNPKPRVIEKVLMLLRMQIDKMLERQGRSRREIDLQHVSMDKDFNKDFNKDSSKSPKHFSIQSAVIYMDSAT